MEQEVPNCSRSGIIAGLYSSTRCPRGRCSWGAKDFVCPSRERSRSCRSSYQPAPPNRRPRNSAALRPSVDGGLSRSVAQSCDEDREKVHARRDPILDMDFVRGGGRPCRPLRPPPGHGTRRGGAREESGLYPTCESCGARRQGIEGAGVDRRQTSGAGGEDGCLRPGHRAFDVAQTPFHQGRR